MKKDFEAPAIRFAFFKRENIITASGGITGTHANDVAAERLKASASAISVNMADVLVF